jgi:hypothetical protein
MSESTGLTDLEPSSKASDYIRSGLLISFLFTGLSSDFLGLVILSLARAVVPPPRLRAKWVFFSAVLHPAKRPHSRAL